MFSFDTTAVEGSPSTGSLTSHRTDDLANVGTYAISIREYFWDDEAQFTEKNIVVEIIDTCSLTAIDASSAFFVSIYDAANEEIKVSWSAFDVSPEDNEFCPSVALDFSATSSAGRTDYSFDLDSRTAIIEVVDVVEMTTFSFEAVEAVYAVDLNSRSS